jgi:hypothetical protein
MNDLADYLASYDPADDDPYTWQQNDEARDTAQSEEFRQAALGKEDKDRTLTLSDLETRDFAQLAALRKHYLPFEELNPLDGDEDNLP